MNARIYPTRVLGAVMYRWQCTRCDETSRRFRTNQHAVAGARSHRCATGKPAPPRRVSPLEM